MNLRRKSCAITIAGLWAAFLFVEKLSPEYQARVLERSFYPGKVSHNGLFIYVSSWGEGMSSWMISLSELLLMARALNATLVEPCMKNGRLVTCDNVEQLVRLGDVFDLEQIPASQSLLLSHEEFKRQTANAIVHKLCMQRKKSHPDYKVTCKGLPSRHMKKRIPELEAAIQDSWNGPSVLEILNYRKFALTDLKHGQSKLISSEEVELMKSNYLRFRKEHYVYVDLLLKKANLTNSFSVIHWRAEKENMDYLGCAQDIMQVRKRMEHQNKTPFILMSSLNTQKEHMWNGARKKASNSTADAALRLLLNDQNFIKLDTLIEDENLKDPGLLAVWDVIIATKASGFATCARGCGEICQRCNHLGRFAAFAIEIRNKLNRSSHECWPS